jgi:hypothetical protein
MAHRTFFPIVSYAPPWIDHHRTARGWRSMLLHVQPQPPKVVLRFCDMVKRGVAFDEFLKLYICAEM